MYPRNTLPETLAIMAIIAEICPPHSHLLPFHTLSESRAIIAIMTESCLEVNLGRDDVAVDAAEDDQADVGGGWLPMLLFFAFPAAAARRSTPKAMTAPLWASKRIETT